MDAPPPGQGRRRGQAPPSTSAAGSGISRRGRGSRGSPSPPRRSGQIARQRRAVGAHLPQDALGHRLGAAGHGAVALEVDGEHPVGRRPPAGRCGRGCARRRAPASGAVDLDLGQACPAPKTRRELGRVEHRRRLGEQRRRGRRSPGSSRAASAGRSAAGRPCRCSSSRCIAAPRAVRRVRSVAGASPASSTCAPPSAEGASGGARAAGGAGRPRRPAGQRRRRARGAAGAAGDASRQLCDSTSVAPSGPGSTRGAEPGHRLGRPGRASCRRRLAGSAPAPQTISQAAARVSAT